MYKEEEKIEQEVNMKITCIAIQTSEKAGQAFFKALSKFSSRLKESETMNKTTRAKPAKEHAGKMVKVKDLRKDGSQIEFIDMGTDDLKDFRKYARKYGVSYSMEKSNESDPPTYFIYFKAKDSVFIDKAIKEYVADRMKDKDQSKAEGIKDKLIEAKAKSAAQVRKVRNKEQIR